MNNSSFHTKPLTQIVTQDFVRRNNARRALHYERLKPACPERFDGIIPLAIRVVVEKVSIEWDASGPACQIAGGQNRNVSRASHHRVALLAPDDVSYTASIVNDGYLDIDALAQCTQAQTIPSFKPEARRQVMVTARQQLRRTIGRLVSIVLLGRDETVVLGIKLSQHPVDNQRLARARWRHVV